MLSTANGNVQPTRGRAKIKLKVWGSAKIIFLHDNDNSDKKLDCSNVKIISVM